MRGELLLLVCCLPAALGLGGEIANYTVNPLSSDQSSRYRQNVCSRYEQFSRGEIQLRDALAGMSLRAFFGAPNSFFRYDFTTGLDAQEPGLLAEIMDNLANRANFTWRSSFGVAETLPRTFNLTWTEFLLWSIDNFDVSVGWYDNSIERMDQGAAFVEAWYDSSLILIHKPDPPERSDINLLNWAKPFDADVWTLIIFTIVLSALVFQLIEHLNGEREDRPLTQWLSDNIYLSSLNFTQNFEYAPNCVAGRIFGVSVSIWALVITATYTANLASLFVEQKQPALTVDSIDQAVVSSLPICVLGGSNHESFLRNKHKRINLAPQATELGCFKALQRGDCSLVAVAKDSWLTYEKKSQYNPDCDLKLVGLPVTIIPSGFAVKADGRELCSSLIRDVMTLHMLEFISDGGLEEAWQRHRARVQDTCLEGSESSLTTPFGGTLRRQLWSDPTTNIEDTKSLLPASNGSSQSRRVLKGGGGRASASASAGEVDTGNDALSVDQMLGTFLLHWVSMAVAILVSLIASYYEKSQVRVLEKQNLVKEEVSFRKHGPTIGMSPRMNTFVIREAKSGPVCGDSDAGDNDVDPIAQPQRHSSRSIMRNSTRGYSTKQLDDPEREQSYAEIRNSIIAALDESQEEHSVQFQQWQDRAEQKQQAMEHKQLICNLKIEQIEERMEKMEDQLAKILMLLQQQ